MKSNFSLLVDAIADRNGFDRETAEGVADLLIGKWKREHWDKKDRDMIPQPERINDYPYSNSLGKPIIIPRGGGGANGGAVIFDIPDEPVQFSSSCGGSRDCGSSSCQTHSKDKPYRGIGSPCAHCGRLACKCLI